MPAKPSQTARERNGGPGLPGAASGHDGDHGPVEYGFVAGGQPLVVADGPAVPGDPGQGAFDDPSPQQHLERMQADEAADDLHGELEELSRPGD
jgi:hypothetical protein